MKPEDVGRKAMTNLDSVFKKNKDITLPTKVCTVKPMIFLVFTYTWESWTIKKAECQRLDAFKLWCWRKPFDSKEIKQVNLKGNQPWTLIGRTDAEAEAPILWPRDANKWLIGKDPDAGKDWRLKEKTVTEDAMSTASPMQWTWTWANSRRGWGTGKPSMLQSLGS